MLKQGSQGARVVELQQQLIDLGYDAGQVDGIFGPNTRAAVISFQRNQGLSADGIVGPRTRAALDSVSAGC